MAVDNFGYDVAAYGVMDCKFAAQTSAKMVCGDDDAPLLHPNGLGIHNLLRPENQFRMSSCTGNAASTCCEAIATLQMGMKLPPQLSRWFAYIMGQKEWGRLGQDRGCTIQHVIMSMKKNGICLESIYQYPSKYTTAMTDAALRDAEKRKIAEHVYIGSASEAVRFLDSGFGSILIGVPWTREMASHRGEFTTSMAKSRNVNGGHAMAVVDFWSPGPKLKDFIDGGHFYTANSHGEKEAIKTGVGVVQFWGQSNSSTMAGISDLSSFDKPRLLTSYQGLVNPGSLSIRRG